MSEQISEAILRRYLLADLDEAERERIEERLFSDERFVEEMARAEASLIDDYALKVLSRHDCDLFEQNFILTDERRKNLLFAQAVDAFLEQEISRPAEPQLRRWWKRLLPSLTSPKSWATLAAGAAAVVLIVFLASALIKWVRVSDQLASLQAQREEMQRRVTELSRRPVSSDTTPAAELSLQPTSLLRGDGDLKQIEIPKDVGILNLQLVLPVAQDSKYLVIMRKVEGDELFSLDDLSPRTNGSSSIFLQIPTEFLATGDYQLEVKGISGAGGNVSVGLYNLRVINSASRRSR
jgi:hypothetical protein